MDANAVMDAEVPGVERDAAASGVDGAIASPDWPTGLEGTAVPPGEQIRRSRDRRSRSTSDSRHRGGRPRAKLGLLTWAGAYAVIVLVLAVGGPVMANWPLALRALMLSGLILVAKTLGHCAGDDPAV